MTHTLEQWLERYESGQIGRRAFLAGVAGLVAASGADAQPAQAPVAGSGLHHVEIKTIDLARSSAFYRKLFGVTGETRADDRVVLPFGTGASKGYLSIGRGPIPRVDHFSVKVPAMHPKDPKATAARLTAAGFKARQAASSVYVMDPDGFEVEVQAPNTVP
jgi:catechol 2,3-dioxygenase-like lactoylglutathione lyase family enzyme